MRKPSRALSALAFIVALVIGFYLAMELFAYFIGGKARG